MPQGAPAPEDVEKGLAVLLAVLLVRLLRVHRQLHPHLPRGEDHQALGKLMAVGDEAAARVVLGFGLQDELGEN